MASWTDVRRIVLALPKTTEERASTGRLWWFAGKKTIALQRPLRRSDIVALGDKAPRGPILCVRTPDLEMKAVLLASEPDVIFTTPHFDGYPAVLIQLKKIGVRKLRQIILEAWLEIAPKRAVAEYLQDKASRQ